VREEWRTVVTIIMMPVSHHQSQTGGAPHGLSISAVGICFMYVLHPEPISPHKLRVPAVSDLSSLHTAH
jgi:hypothetical protein